jgi:hypothetical protein
VGPVGSGVDSNDSAAGESERHASMGTRVAERAAGSGLLPFGLAVLAVACEARVASEAWLVLGSWPAADALGLPFFFDFSRSESALAEGASTEPIGEVSDGSLTYG